ncbi:MAG: hypothetical protein WBJ82_06805 [Tepidanaerobacteraceae bacterium]
MYKKLISLLKEEKGYNTVEALLWIAAVAVLCVAVNTALKDKLTGTGGAVETIDGTITNLLEEAQQRKGQLSGQTNGG